jgi:general secretion pathway protein E/type IV pilus assembly protein PilB
VIDIESNSSDIVEDKPDDDSELSGFSFVDATVDGDIPLGDTGVASTAVVSGDVYDFVDGQEELSSGTDIAVQKKSIKTQRDSATGATGKIRLGDRLVEMGVMTQDQLMVALQEQDISGKMLGEAIVDLGFADQETITIVLAQSAGFEVFDPKSTIFDGDALSMLSKEDATRLKMLPVSLSGDELSVALVDPYDVVNMDALRRKVPRGVSIKPLVATPSIISDAVDAAYGYASNIDDILKELEEVEDSDLTNLSANEAYTHPIVRLVNSLLFEAVKLGVSDLHFEPEENFIRLRYRLDGVLYTAQILHKKHWNGISQRIKIMSNMNIADKLTPQDGRFNLNVGGREADFRVSSLPTVHGENIVLRVLDKSSSILPMEALGFSPTNLANIKKAQSTPEGIIIVTGPTGSGKSTSLYSMLNAINDVEINIQTLEDPVEYSLPMIRQTHVREGILDFADGIKALLRQDPDIIFIGEIRDKTTAEMALKAAMTGHQVYTTLHTNDSFGAIPRMLDLGLKPGMIAGAVVSIFAQRLGRRLCGDCKIEYSPSAEEKELLRLDPDSDATIFKAKEGGCDSCSGQGYKGRVAIVEILMFDEDLNDIVAAGGSKADLKVAAKAKGFKNMADDGRLKITEGVSSIEAVLKVVSL